jgi:small conductance mechanosensitive channel
LFNAIEPFRILREEVAGLAASAVALIPNFLAGLVVVLVTWALAALLSRGAGRLFRRHARPALRQLMVTLTRVLVWVVGLLVAAVVVFPNLTPTKLLAGLGLGSIAVGLAFKDIFENFLAGIMILVRAPMRIGDDIVCEGIAGRVEEITIRETHIRKRSGELVLVPNAFLFKNPVRVLTDRPLRRIELVVGVGYAEDLGHCREVIARAFDGLATVQRSERVEVFAQAFGESSVDFLVRWWAGSTPIDEHRSRDEVAAAIKRALDDAGIEMPFPQRTLTFKEPLALTRRTGEESPAESSGAPAS